MSFDKSEFARILNIAKGDRSINKYGMDSGVDPGYISRLLRSLIDTPPSATIINKLALKAYNNISVEDLLNAAGYLSSDTKKESEDISPSDILSDPLVDLFAKNIPNLTPELRRAIEELIKHAIEINKNRKPDDPPIIEVDID